MRSRRSAERSSRSRIRTALPQLAALCVALLVVLGSVATVSAAGGALQDDTDSETPEAISTGTDYTETLDENDSTDVFTFSAQEDEYVRLSARVGTPDVVDATLYGPSGEQLDGDEVYVDTTLLGFQAPTGGEYRVEFTYSGMRPSSNPQEYDFTVDTASPDGYESNDDIGSAASVSGSASVDAVLGEGDTDYYAVSAASGTTISADVERGVGRIGNSYDVYILDSDGTVLESIETSCTPGAGPCNPPEISATAPSDGEYYVEVSGGMTGFDAYTLSVDADAPAQDTETTEDTEDTETPDDTTEEPESGDSSDDTDDEDSDDSAGDLDGSTDDGSENADDSTEDDSDSSDDSTDSSDDTTEESTDDSGDNTDDSTDSTDNSDDDTSESDDSTDESTDQNDDSDDTRSDDTQSDDSADSSDDSDDSTDDANVGGEDSTDGSDESDDGTAGDDDQSDDESSSADDSDDSSTSDDDQSSDDGSDTDGSGDAASDDTDQQTTTAPTATPADTPTETGDETTTTDDTETAVTTTNSEEAAAGPSAPVNNSTNGSESVVRGGDETETETSSGFGPGFGVVTALVALLAAALLARREQ